MRVVLQAGRRMERCTNGGRRSVGPKKHDAYERAFAAESQAARRLCGLTGITRAPVGSGEGGIPAGKVVQIRAHLLGTPTK